MDLIKIDDDNNKKYEDLIILKSELLNDAKGYYISYKKKFGNIEIQIYKEEIECIKYKKIISYLQSLINHEKTLDIEILNAEISQQMLSYQLELEKRMEELSYFNSLTTVKYSEKMEIKKIYKKLVKIFHPDINKLTESNKQISDLWNEIVTAYKNNDFDRLSELEVIGNKIIRDYNIDINFKLNIDDVEEKIKKIESEIEHIVNTEPYVYKKILENENKIKEQHEEYQSELKKYEDYKKELIEMVKQLKEKLT